MRQPAPSRRQRLRTQARAEAKALALGQLADAGPGALSLTAIAHQMGLTGPALYRYFADRDALLAELVLDAYADLATTLAGVEAANVGPPAARFRAFAAAYRAWAIEQPHRYRLLFGAPVPGFAAHSERIVAAAQRTMDAMLAILGDMTGRDADVAPPGPPAGLEAQFQTWASKRGVEGVAPAALWRGVLSWSRLHGLVSLEIGGNFASMGIDAAALYEAEVSELLGDGRAP